MFAGDPLVLWVDTLVDTLVPTQVFVLVIILVRRKGVALHLSNSQCSKRTSWGGGLGIERADEHVKKMVHG